MQPSLSKVNLRIVVQGRGIMEGEAFRHLAPTTMSAILRNIPLKGRVNRFEELFIYITSGVVAGVEKARSTFRRGDIAFLALNGGLCFFLKDCKVAKPMNPIGRITAGLEVLEKAGTGDVIEVGRP